LIVLIHSFQPDLFEFFISDVVRVLIAALANQLLSSRANLALATRRDKPEWLLLNLVLESLDSP